MTFAPGDIVALKSGGHSMTVVSAEDNDIECLWLGDAGELFRQSIPAVALTMLESEAEDAAEEDAEHEDEDEDDEDDDKPRDDDEDEDDEREEKRRAKGR